MNKNIKKIGLTFMLGSFVNLSLSPSILAAASTFSNEQESNEITSYLLDTSTNFNDIFLNETYRTVNNTESIDALIDEYDDLNNVPIDINNIETSPFYNNMEYYNSTVNIGTEKGFPQLILLTTIVLRTAWQTGVPQKFLKYVTNAVVTGLIGNIAYNGLPLVTPAKQYVGYGYYEQGNVVKTAQLALRSLGYKIDADGYYGPKTRDAIIAFQKKENITADGIVGKVTWERLFK